MMLWQHVRQAVADYDSARSEEYFTRQSTASAQALVRLRQAIAQQSSDATLAPDVANMLKASGLGAESRLRSHLTAAFHNWQAEQRQAEQLAAQRLEQERRNAEIQRAKEQTKAKMLRDVLHSQLELETSELQYQISPKEITDSQQRVALTQVVAFPGEQPLQTYYPLCERGLPDLKTTDGTAEQTLLQLAVETIAWVRAKLPKGPLNNRGLLSSTILDRAKYPRWVSDLTSLALRKGIDLRGGVKPERVLAIEEDWLFQHSLLANLVMLQGGGVCSEIACLTFARLTMTAPAGTKICHVIHEVDHEFVVIKGPKTGWIVVDPWPHTAWAIPWEDCYFQRTGVRSFFRVDVQEKLGQACGWPISKHFCKGLVKLAQEELPAPTDRDKATVKTWTQRCNLLGCDCHKERKQDRPDICRAHPGPRRLKGAGPDQWG